MGSCSGKTVLYIRKIETKTLRKVIDVVLSAVSLSNIGNNSILSFMISSLLLLSLPNFFKVDRKDDTSFSLSLVDVVLFKVWRKGWIPNAASAGVRGSGGGGGWCDAIVTGNRETTRGGVVPTSAPQGLKVTKFLFLFWLA